MFRPNWRDPEDFEVERIDGELDRLGKDARPSRPKITIASLDPEEGYFYKGCVLVRVGYDGNTDPFRERFFLLDDDSIVRLNWTNQPIYEYNEKLSELGRFTLNRRTIPNYARFFFHMVRGQLGSFIIVEQPGDLDEMWLPDTKIEAKAAIVDLVRPMAYKSIYERHFYRLDAVVVFKNALFQTDILVTPYGISHAFDQEGGIPETFSKGQLTLANDVLLLEDQPLKIDPPPPLEA